ncbi:LysM peptidoglycan-binding domain-containing protein [Candidatus Halobeggiatoa sp. HSG11]|nr:LysM peptidoglycan-binding domain-containing protein [Candidatus Halobeggiatoa sp. HSG11]
MGTYTIDSGDTLYSVARKYDISFGNLMTLNPQITDAGNISVGQTINVPGDGGAAAQPTTAAAAPPPAPAAAPAGGQAASGAPWLAVAEKEMEMGVTEIEGDQDNPRIVEYHQATSLQATDDETPWCSAFANWCMKQVGVQGTGSAASSSWRTWGQEVGAVQGSLVCFNGHVGFLHSIRNDGKLLILGGNQSNQVKITPYDKDKALTYRWPA